MAESNFVLINQLEHGAIVRHDHFAIIGMSLRPFVKVEILPEDIGIQKFLDKDTFFHDFWQIVQEKEGRHKIVLIFGDVPHDPVNSAYLIIPECDINCISILDFLD